MFLNLTTCFCCENLTKYLWYQNNERMTEKMIYFRSKTCLTALPKRTLWNDVIELDTQRPPSSLGATHSNKVWKPAFICICNVCWPPVSRIRVWTAWRTGSHWISPSLHVLTVYRPEQGFSTFCTRRTTGLKFNLRPKDGEFYPDSRRGSDGEDGVHAAGLAVVSVVDVAAVFW